MNNPLGVNPSKGNHGTTRGKEKNLLTSVGIEPTTPLIYTSELIRVVPCSTLIYTSELVLCSTILDLYTLFKHKCENTFMGLNDRSLTNQKDGLSNSLNLTSQDFYVRLVDQKTKENNSVLVGRTISLPRSFLLSSLSTVCHAG